MPDMKTTGIMSSTPAVATSSAIAHYLNASANATARSSFLSISPRELLKLPIRAVYQAEVFTFVTIPREFGRLLGLDNIAANLWDSPMPMGGERNGIPAGAATAGAAVGGAAEAGARDAGLNFAELFQAMRRFSGFFSYMTSRWSLACFTVALVLNRVTIYASTRRHLSLRWDKRLALRIIPILLFMIQIMVLLRAIRCQTSPDYSEIRYGNPGRRLTLDYAGSGGFLYNLSSTLLFWETDQQSCSAVNMGRPVNGADVPHGSFALLWPVFIRLCLSHFVETLSCALQGRTVVTEAGMSIFEHSLAFAEAETMISQSIGLGLFGLPKSSSAKDDSPLTSDGSPSSVHLLTRAQVLERMNVTPELLLIALISCCNSMTSNILDVFGKQSRYRLINTTIWGLCFMGAMVWGFIDSTSFGSETGVLKFPTVCIVGFVPHLLILVGILVCISIYGLAVTITAFCLPTDLEQPSSIRERFALAHENMQGGNQIRNVRLNMHEDFYTTLLRVGYAALTAASEAVFLNEGKSVVARPMTWLEEDRFAELETSRRRRSSRMGGRPESRETPFETAETFEFSIPETSTQWESGYGREKKIEKPAHGSRQVRSQSSLGGVGAFQGATRGYHVLSFFRSIFYLILRWIAYGFSRLLDRVGISSRPQWLSKLIGTPRNPTHIRNMGQQASLDFWILTDEGELELPEDNEFDVEKEMRKREIMSRDNWDELDENRLETKLYNWWKVGGSWGNQDQSPDYVPTDDDLDDTTSVISTATDSEWEDYESDGRRTPTQGNPFPTFSREGTPVRETLLDTASLARLLNPRDRASKEEARILAAHLTGEKGSIMTRSRFQRQIESERARVLLSSRYHSALHNHSSDGHKRPTPEEEAEMLENLILSRRQDASNSRSQQASWENGASGLGPDGPQCVICQTNPRSIITWPCRCLCVCEECRVSLAMNNFGSCVTCRQEVTGFVRLWVP